MSIDHPESGNPVPEPLSREHRVAAAFVNLADTLVDDFDALDLLATLTERSVDLLDATAAGILLADQRGGLRVAAASSEAARLIELFELQTDEGPCRDCYATGAPVISHDLSSDTERWGRFVPRAQEGGFGAVSALPLRLRGDVIGALNIFFAAPPGLTRSNQQLGQALADVATIGILQERAIQRGEMLTEQLQTALNSRVSIEQAKGILAASSADSLSMGDAFKSLRAYARANHLRLTDLAAAVVNGQANPTRILQSIHDTGQA